MATLTRKRSFAEIADKIDDLFYSMAMLDQADVVDIELISSKGSFPNFHVPTGLVDSSIKDFIRQRMNEKVNELKSQLSALVTTYEIPADPVPTPAPEPTPVPTAEPAPAPVDPAIPQPDVVQPVDPNAGPTTQ